jgi:hypothetical protein
MILQKIHGEKATEAAGNLSGKETEKQLRGTLVENHPVTADGPGP